MKKIIFLVLCCALHAGCASHRGADRGGRPKGPADKTSIVSSQDSYRVAGRFRGVAAFRSWIDGKTKLAIGTEMGYLHIMSFGLQGMRLEWQSPFLGAPVRGVLVRDLQGLGFPEILVYTAAGRMMAIGMGDYSVVRENAAFDMVEISHVVAMQLDDDPALELLACGGDRFSVYDGATFFTEWQAPGSVPGDWLAVGDVDGDRVLEVVLNSGYVLDAKFFRLEMTLGYLGERIEIMDVDADGVDEIIAESDQGSITVYDARMPGVPEY